MTVLNILVNKWLFMNSLWWLLSVTELGPRRLWEVGKVSQSAWVEALEVRLATLTKKEKKKNAEMRKLGLKWCLSTEQQLDYL